MTCINKIVVFDEAHRLFRPFNPCDPNSTIIEMIEYFCFC